MNQNCEPRQISARHFGGCKRSFKTIRANFGRRASSNRPENCSLCGAAQCILGNLGNNKAPDINSIEASTECDPSDSTPDPAHKSAVARHHWTFPRCHTLQRRGDQRDFQTAFAAHSAITSTASVSDRSCSFHTTSTHASASSSNSHESFGPISNALLSTTKLCEDGCHRRHRRRITPCSERRTGDRSTEAERHHPVHRRPWLR